MTTVGQVQLKACLEPVADNQNFSLFVGEAKDLTVTLTDGYGNAVNLTGLTLAWTLEQNQSSTTASVSKSSSGTTPGITITNATAGQFTIALADADTNTLTAGTYYHVASLTDVSGNKSIIMEGSAYLTAMPTNI